jgi:3-oxo-4,17-pregnadiene-20-carboxyl-CoA hydratase alpha subunit
MSDQMPGLPGPAPDPTTAGYWLAAGRGELVVQVCSACGTHRHPPTEVCYVCNSLDWAWQPHDGRGTVFTYTWTDRPVVPALANLGVYNVSVVELEGTTGVVRILSRVTDIDRDDLVVGLPVEVHFDPAGSSLEGAALALPLFRPRAAG